MSQLNPPVPGNVRPLSPFARRPNQVATAAPGDKRVDLSTQQSAISFTVIMFLICLTVPVTFSVGPVVMSFLRLILIASFIPTFMAWASGKAGKILATEILLLLFCLWVMLSIAVQHGIDAIEFAGINMVECFGAYLLGRVFIRTSRQFNTMVKWLGYVILMTIPIALYESLTGVALISSVLRALPLVNGPVDVPTDVRLGLHRAQGAFETPIHYGLFCACGFVLLFKAGPQSRPGAIRWIWGGVAFFGTFLALSSGPLMALAVQGILLGWNWVFRHWKMRWQMLLGMVVLAYVFVDIVAARPPLNVFLHYASLNSGSAWWRVAIFEAGIENIRENPILGLGLRDWQRPAWMHSASVDNYWLLTTMRYGIPALIFMALTFLSAVFLVGRSKFRQAESEILCRYAWVFLIVSLIILLFTVHIWTATYSMVFFLIGSGMWLALPSLQPAPSRRRS